MFAYLFSGSRSNCWHFSSFLPISLDKIAFDLTRTHTVTHCSGPVFFFVGVGEKQRLLGMCVSYKWCNKLSSLFLFDCLSCHIKNILYQKVSNSIHSALRYHIVELKSTERHSTKMLTSLALECLSDDISLSLDLDVSSVFLSCDWRNVINLIINTITWSIKKNESLLGHTV